MPRPPRSPRPARPSRPWAVPHPGAENADPNPAPESIDLRDPDRTRFIDRFRSYPRTVFDDPELRSHHQDLLMALAAMTRWESSTRIITYPPEGITSDLLSHFSCVARSKIGFYLGEIADVGHIRLDREGRGIVRTRWHARHYEALRGRESWFAVPKAVLYDRTLSSRQKHAYLAVNLLRYTTMTQAQRQHARRLDRFYVAPSLLATVMHLGCPKTARKFLKELRELRLIEETGGPDHRGMRQLQLVPLEVRYAYRPDDGKRYRGVPLYLPYDDVEARYQSYRATGRVTARHIKVEISRAYVDSQGNPSHADVSVGIG